MGGGFTVQLDLSIPEPIVGLPCLSGMGAISDGWNLYSKQAHHSLYQLGYYNPLPFGVWSH